MRTVIVGAGAMGSLLAARLTLAQGTANGVTLYSRPSSHLTEIASNGLHFTALDGSERRLAVTVTDDPAVVAGADLLIVLVKAWATAEALRPLAPYCGARTAVLTLQNGLNNAEQIATTLQRPLADVLVGTTSEGAMRPGTGEVRHMGPGETVLGRFGGGQPAELVAAAEMLRRAVSATTVAEDIHPHLWQKLAVNAGLNATTALAGVPNGALLEQAGLRRAALTLTAEAAAVARAQGIDPGDAGGKMVQVAAATPGNRSSMLVDWEQRRRTEVDAIHGVVVERGGQWGVATPVSAWVWAILSAEQGATRARESKGS